jgi:hypothetical protein
MIGRLCLCLDLAHRYCGGVSACLVGRGRQVRKWCVRGVTGIEAEGVGVGAGESFNE